MSGFPDTIWLTAQQRDDQDEAAFGELSFDITPHLTATAGARYFRTNNSLKGFFGFGAGFSGSTGEAVVFLPTTASMARPAPTWTSRPARVVRWARQPDLAHQRQQDDVRDLVGRFPPRRHQPRSTLPPYKSDFLTNYELGWKTTWGGNVLSWNGAVFQEDWKDFQFSYLGQNGLTEIHNAGQARIRGLETDLRWAATYNLAFTGGAAFYDAKLTENFCGWLARGRIRKPSARPGRDPRAPSTIPTATSRSTARKPLRARACR